MPNHSTLITSDGGLVLVGDGDGVAGWWGHLNIGVDDKIRGIFLRFVLN